MVSCLIFKPLSHLELIFVYGVSVCSNVVDLHAATQFSEGTSSYMSTVHCIRITLIGNLRSTVMKKVTVNVPVTQS